jgi:O-antigen/teichoic acid export membrane protein
MQLKRSQGTFFKRTIYTVNSFGMTLVLNLLTGILISRGLGPHGKGVYTAITTWATVLLWIFNVSLYQVTVFYFGKEPSNRRTVFTTLIIASLFLGLFASATGEIAVVPLLRRNGITSNIGLIRLLFLTLPLSTMFQVVSGGLNGSMKFAFTNTVRIVQPLTMGIAWTALYLRHEMNVAACLRWYIVISTIFNILGLVYAFKERMFGRKFSWSLLKSGLTYGLKAHGATTADVVSGSIAPVFLSLMLPAAYLGYFSAAQSAAGTLNVFSMALAMTGFPLLSSIEHSKTHSTTMRMWRASLFVTAPAMIVMAALFPVIVPMVYGKSFDGAINCSIILLVSVVLSGQAYILRNALNSRGYSLINSTSEAIALIFTLGGMSVLPRYFGVEGAALAAVMGSIARLALLMRSYAVHIQRIRPLELFPGRSEVKYFISIITVLKARVSQRA